MLFDFNIFVLEINHYHLLNFSIDVELMRIDKIFDDKVPRYRDIYYIILSLSKCFEKAWFV